MLPTLGIFTDAAEAPGADEDQQANNQLQMAESPSSSGLEDNPRQINITGVVYSVKDPVDSDNIDEASWTPSAACNEV